jgi:tetratricopeptide (TPR) repeat protein
MWHYARAVALGATHRIVDARREQESFVVAQGMVPRDAKIRVIHTSEVLALAEKVLAGELFYREGRVPQAIAALNEGIQREDRMPYAEPPYWQIPVRHVLGAVLMDDRRFAEAEPIYREDLHRHPENGWALYGLARSLEMQGKTAEAAVVWTRFEKAWQYADFKIVASCCCLPDRTRGVSK